MTPDLLPQLPVWNREELINLIREIDSANPHHQWESPQEGTKDGCRSEIYRFGGLPVFGIVFRTNQTEIIDLRAHLRTTIFATAQIHSGYKGSQESVHFAFIGGSVRTICNGGYWFATFENDRKFASIEEAFNALRKHSPIVPHTLVQIEDQTSTSKTIPTTDSPIEIRKYGECKYEVYISGEDFWRIVGSVGTV